jgi:4-hydroxy-tetrahydrodipicolinate synthase
MLPTGAGTALITPFTADGKVDVPALTRLVEWQVTEGIDFVVACGSTGEAQTLSPEERILVTKTIVAAADGQIPVLAGATDNDTGRAVAEARVMADLGVVGIMSASPYYNKPTQAGLEAHFRSIADAISLPVLLYNVPGRTSIDLKAETVAALASHHRIAGIKEASGNVRRMLDLKRLAPTDFRILCGDDDIVVPAMAAGAVGLISVASNAIPRRISRMVAAAGRGDWAGALKDQLELLPFIDALFAESNPIPVKAVLEMMGKASGAVRLPLLTATPPLREKLKGLLADLESSHHG